MNSKIPCCNCGGTVIEFIVPNKLWNMVIRQSGHEGDKEYLCFACWNNAIYKYIEQLHVVGKQLKIAKRGIIQAKKIVASQSREAHRILIATLTEIKRIENGE